MSGKGSSPAVPCSSPSYPFRLRCPLSGSHRSVPSLFVLVDPRFYLRHETGRFRLLSIFQQDLVSVFIIYPRRDGADGASAPLSCRPHVRPNPNPNPNPNLRKRRAARQLNWITLHAENIPRGLALPWRLVARGQVVVVAVVVVTAVVTC